MTLSKKIQQSIHLLQQVAMEGKTMEIAYSGGKDSEVILQLAKEANVPFVAQYKNTTIDPPGTIAHVKSKGVKVLQPPMTFAQIIAKKGLPTRQHRFCCSVLKETWGGYDYTVIGVRKEESKKRNEIYHEPITCALDKKHHYQKVMPILEWTNEDVKKFIIDRNIQCHPIYYKDGILDTTQRLGCMCCPLQYYKKRIQEFAKYPKMLKLYYTNLQKFCSTHKHEYSAEEWLVMDVFYKSNEDFRAKRNGMFETINYKLFLENKWNKI